MRIHELNISHFRGIESMIWRPAAGLTCLVGPGDSTKTTVLDALSVLLAARWNAQFNDADFTSGDTSRDVVIAATLGGLPDELMRHEVFGMMLRGIDPDGEIVDDPLPSCDEAVTLELRVDASLEPTWAVIKDSLDEPRRIPGRTRELLSAVRLDDGVDHHLRWARGTALSRLTGPAPELPLLLADSHRAARSAVFSNPDAQLQDAAKAARVAARARAAIQLRDLRPGLDPSVYSRHGSLNLHEGELPLSTYGLGTRRLVGLALQLAAGGGGSIVLVDEIEAGLDPHRLRRFVRELERATAAGDQVIMATHSPLVLEQLGAEHIAVVRSTDGATSITTVPEELSERRNGFSGVVRATPSALLSRRVVVGEGATEVGFLEGFLDATEEQIGRSAAEHGVAIANGGDGAQAAIRARLLAELGYEAAIVVDHDDPSIDDEVAAAEAAGVAVVRWEQGNTLEQQVFLDVPDSTLVDLLQAAIEIRRIEHGGEADHAQAILDSTSAQLPAGTPRPQGTDPTRWATDDLPLDEIRIALGRAAKKGWFKRQQYGQVLGRIVAEQALDANPLRSQLDALLAFALPPPNDDG